jgi:hypothetical protein
MALYLVSYDLRDPRNYQSVYRVLDSLGARRALRSSYWVESESSAIDLRELIRCFISVSDGLVVTEVGDWATVGAPAPRASTAVT